MVAVVTTAHMWVAVVTTTHDVSGLVPVLSLPVDVGSLVLPEHRLSQPRAYHVSIAQPFSVLTHMPQTQMYMPSHVSG